MLISTFFLNRSITEILEVKSFRSTIQFSYLLSLFDKTYFTFCLKHSKTTQITLITRIIICCNNNNIYIFMYNIYLYFISAMRSYLSLLVVLFHIFFHSSCLCIFLFYSSLLVYCIKLFLTI